MCREIGLAAWLDTQDEHSHECVSVGTATAAMILNGLGFSNRRLYLVPRRGAACGAGYGHTLAMPVAHCLPVLPGSA